MTKTGDRSWRTSGCNHCCGGSGSPCDHIHQPRSYAVSWKYGFRDRRREGRDHGAGCSVIYDGNDPDAAVVMRENAEKLGCPYYELKREDTEIHKITKDGIRFSLKDESIWRYRI